MIQSPRLSANARTAIADVANVLFVSAVSPYELEWKKALGKLAFPDVGNWRQALHDAGYQELPLTVSHAQHAARLARIHRDPWDRLLVAQAQTEQLTLVTADGKLSQYGVPTLW